MMPNPPRTTGLVVVALAVGLCAFLATTATTSGASRAASVRTCAFTLRIGDVLPFTGDLASYGPNFDRAVKLAVSVQNAALKKLHLSSKIKVTLVDSQDGQTQATASVEAATKEVKSEHVNVVIGEMSSSATIPMAQSVTIPNHVVQISPTASAPQLSSIKDNGYLWSVYPLDTLESKVLALATVQAFGKGATINVGSRNDASGQAVRRLFVARYKKLGGKIGVNISWNPDQSTFDTEAQQLVRGDPKGWVIIDFPVTFQKFLPSLVRTGRWTVGKTLTTDAMRDGSFLNGLGSVVNGLRGTAASTAGGPAGKAFHALWNRNVRGAKPYTGFEGTAFDAANVAFLAAMRACSASPPKIRNNLIAVSGPPGPKVTFRQMTRAIKLLRAGKDVNYEGAFSPVDFDRSGGISSAVYELWRNNGGGNISTLRTITCCG
jgi:ABC-type branched-subunit amino acid transport system substrate-binding protein